MTTEKRATAQEQARLLSAALPFMQRYENKTVVVKYGGHAMGDIELGKAFARDIALLKQSGVQATRKRCFRSPHRWKSSPAGAPAGLRSTCRASAHSRINATVEIKLEQRGHVRRNAAVPALEPFAQGRVCGYEARR